MIYRVLLAVAVFLAAGCSSHGTPQGVKVGDNLYITGITITECPPIKGVKVCGPWREA